MTRVGRAGYVRGAYVLRASPLRLTRLSAGIRLILLPVAAKWVGEIGGVCLFAAILGIDVNRLCGAFFIVVFVCEVC